LTPVESGIEKSWIFEDDEDREFFLRRLGQLALETGTRIYPWSLLNNHAHLLLKSGPEGLPGFMRRLLDSWDRGFCGTNFGRSGSKNSVSIFIPGSREANGGNNKTEMPGGIGQPGRAKLGGRHGRLSQVRLELARRLTSELGIPLAEIARHLGVSTSAISILCREISHYSQQRP
jgi:hypothetical protein